MRQLLKRPELEELFHQFSGEDLVLSAPELLEFLEVQGEAGATLAHAQQLIQTYELHETGGQAQSGQGVSGNPMGPQDGPGHEPTHLSGLPVAKSHELMTLDGFMMYLLSPEGAALDHTHATVFQDMGQPLSHYFISSSHNTYLTDSQIGGLSSTEAYIRYCTSEGPQVWDGLPVLCPDSSPIHLPMCRAFTQGCRCVELDCWEGPGGEPVVYHGHTLTSKILFRDVVQVVHDHAFMVSPTHTQPQPSAFWMALLPRAGKACSS